MTGEVEACDVCKSIYQVVVNPTADLGEAISMIHRLIKEYELSYNNVIGRLHRVAQRVRRLAGELSERGDHATADAILARMQSLRERTGLIADFKIKNRNQPVPA